MLKKTYPAPKLCNTTNRWYIQYYDLSGTRIRASFDLNRIKDIKEKQKQAKILLKEVSTRCALGVPVVLDVAIDLSSTNIIEAVTRANKIMCDRCDRARTHLNYNSFLGLLTRWLVEKKYNNFTLSTFGKRHALEFCDYVSSERKVGNNTFNCYLAYCKILFNTLVEREYITVNPFKSIKAKQKVKTLRSKFSIDDAQTILTAVKEKNIWLFRAILLQYYCLIRPAELTRLRFQDFNVQAGCITISPEQSKNKLAAVVTVPKSILCHFQTSDFTKNYQSFLIFGTHYKPHASESLGRNTLNYSHKQILLELLKAGKIKTIKNLTFYSWKNMGISDMAKILTPFELQKHARHQDMNHTMIYYREDSDINQNISNMTHIIG